MLITNSSNIADALNAIEIAYGTWTNYGDHGQTTTQTIEGQIDGVGYKARFENNPYGPEYGWGPLAETEEEAISFLLAKAVKSLKKNIKVSAF